MFFSFQIWTVQNVLISQLIHHFETTMGHNAMKFCLDIHGSLRRDPFVGPLTFNVPQSGRNKF